MSTRSISGRVLARGILCAQDDGDDARRGGLLLRVRPKRGLRGNRPDGRAAIPLPDPHTIRRFCPRRPHRRDESFGNYELHFLPAAVARRSISAPCSSSSPNEWTFLLAVQTIISR